MSKYYYKKPKKLKPRKIARVLAGAIFITGLFILGYTYLPFAAWHIYFSPVFASFSLTTPIPQNSLVKSSSETADLTNAQNWFKGVSIRQAHAATPSYSLSIPILDLPESTVSTIDTDLSNHLVHYPGTPLPFENGNAVIFGHSTLPQLFNPKDYKTIFANLYKLKKGDTIYIHQNKVTYTYKVYSLTVVDPDETSLFSQDYSYSHLTLVTCTPPGTTWKRLIVKAKMEKI